MTRERSYWSPLRAAMARMRQKRPIRGGENGQPAGAGPEVRGPGEALYMALNGRTGAIDQLTGDGVPVLAGRIKA